MEPMTRDGTVLSRPASEPPGISGMVSRADRACDRRAILTRAVQLQVIPRLLQQTGAPRRASPLAGHVEHLAALSMRASGRAVVEFTQELLNGGSDAEAIFLDLLTPTAQLLGQYWADDHCTFADVTIGVGHLKTATRVLEAAFMDGAPLTTMAAPRALLLPLPGEQHDYGAVMLSAFFRRAGWDVWAGAMTASAELAETVRGDWIDLVGFSVSHDAALDTVRDEIAAVRRASCNRGLVVMVGGLPFSQSPALAEAVGADGTAPDGAQAVEVARALLPARSPP